MCARYQNLKRHQSDTIDTNLLDSQSCYFPFFFGGVVGFGMHCSAVKYVLSVVFFPGEPIFWTAMNRVTKITANMFFFRYC